MKEDKELKEKLENIFEEGFEDYPTTDKRTKEAVRLAARVAFYKGFILGVKHPNLNTPI